MKVAVLDAGTNTLRLLVASRNPDGSLHDHHRLVSYAGLGQGVDATGVFAPQAIERALDIVRQYRPLLDGVTKTRFVATSASRDAANRDEFFDAVQQIIGIRPELISGDEEAQLSFQGVLSGAQKVTAENPEAKVLVVDSGGGSTELVQGSTQGQLLRSVSLNIGSRRIRERFLHDDRPTVNQITAARAFINDQLQAIDDWGVEDSAAFIGVAGTITTMAAINLGLKNYDARKVHGSIQQPETVIELAEKLLSCSSKKIETLGPVSAQRAQVLSAGALIVAELTKKLDKALIASESDILDGIALQLFNNH